MRFKTVAQPVLAILMLLSTMSAIGQIPTGAVQYLGSTKMKTTSLPMGVYWSGGTLIFKDWVGMIPITVEGVPVEAYCVGADTDLQWKYLYTAENITMPPNAPWGQIAYMLAKYPLAAYVGSDKQLWGAALQDAIWKLVYGENQIYVDRVDVETLAYNPLLKETAGKSLLSCAAKEVEFELVACQSAVDEVSVLVTLKQDGEPVAGQPIVLTTSQGKFVSPKNGEGVVDKDGHLLAVIDLGGGALPVTITATAQGGTIHWLEGVGTYGDGYQPLIYLEPCKAKAEVTVTECSDYGCPRTIGFWKHQVDCKTKKPQVPKATICQWLKDGLLAPLGDLDFGFSINCRSQLVATLWIENRTATMAQRMRQQLTAVLLNIAYDQLQLNSKLDTGYGVMTLAEAFQKAHAAYVNKDPETAKSIFDNINNLAE